jgi:hypothetical protein
MAGTAPQVEWYLARGGQQYGPLSDLEMRKFVDLGHLRPGDLLWRTGFSDWRPGSDIFPQLNNAKPQPMAPPASPRTGPPTRTAQPARTASPRPAGPTVTTPAAPDRPAERRESGEQGAKLGRIGFVVLALALLSGAGWLAWQHRDRIPEVTQMLTSIQVQAVDSGPALYRVSPFAASGDTAESIDAGLQKAALWRVLKQEFGEWYQARVKDVVRLRAEKRDDAAVQKLLAESVVVLRRKHAAQALSASPKNLRQIANSFHENLLQMAKIGTEHCFGLISYGEASAQVLEMVKDPAQSEHLHRQMTAIFEAVANGRKTPQTYAPAAKADYDVLVDNLKGRGWGQTELQTFSDQRLLAKAPHDQVCRLVQDWIGAHLSVQDAGTQSRLLSETLRPLVHG